MKFTEIIEKVKNNLKIQEDLKTSLMNEEQSLRELEEKLVKLNEALNNGVHGEKSLRDDLVSGLIEETRKLQPNLVMDLYSNLDCGLSLKFMKKPYDLISTDHLVEAGDFERVGEIDIFVCVDVLVDKYLRYGQEIFNKDTLAHINKIKEVYNINPGVIKDKLVNDKFNKKVKKLEDEIRRVGIQLVGTKENIEDVQIEIKKTKEFKSPLLRKIFAKRDKLEEKEKSLYEEFDNLKVIHANLEEKLSKKSYIKEKSVEYVDQELANLMKCFAWMDKFEVIKRKLVRYRVENIQKVKNRIQETQDQLASTKTKIKEDKGLLKLNKKVTNETILNAFNNQEFVAELNEGKPVSSDKEKAVKYVEEKYDEYLKGCIDKLIS